MGKKYAAFNTAGAVTAFYDDVDSPVPAGLKTIVEITGTQWQALLDGQSKGKTIQLDANGIPATVAHPAPSQADLMTATRTQARAMRTPIIGILDGMQSSMLTKGDVSGATVIETAKQGLRDITKTDLSACVTADDMKVAILNQYKAIAADLPANIRAAFAGAAS